MSTSSTRKRKQNKKMMVPTFINKLLKIVEDSSNSEIVSWNSNGNGFIVLKEHEFCESVLPQYFKHQNFSSFVRQLNLYGFHKTNDSRNKEFTHNLFRVDRPDLLSCIKKKEKEKCTSQVTRKMLYSLQKQVHELRAQYLLIWKMQTESLTFMHELSIALRNDNFVENVSVSGIHFTSSATESESEN